MDKLRPYDFVSSGTVWPPADTGNWGIAQVDEWNDCFELDDGDDVLAREAQASVQDGMVTTFINRQMWTRIGDRCVRVLWDGDYFAYKGHTSLEPFPEEIVPRSRTLRFTGAR